MGHWLGIRAGLTAVRTIVRRGAMEKTSYLGSFITGTRDVGCGSDRRVLVWSLSPIQVDNWYQKVAFQG